MSLRIAILGAGAIGAKHAAAAQEAGHVVGAVVDADAARCESLAEAFGCKGATDPAAIWDDATIDAVVIGVPNCFHKQLAIDAMRAGKDVLLEKPMAMNVAECEEICAIEQQTGRVLQIGFAHRYTAVGMAARQVIEAGELGEIYHAKAHLYLKRGIPGLGRWFTTKAVSGGGVLIDVGVHLIDLSLHLLNQPAPTAVLGRTYGRFGSRMQDYVYDSMWAGPPDFDGVFDVEDSAHAMITFDSGATLDLHVSWAGNFPEGQLPVSQIGLFGDKAGMTFELFGDHLNLAGEQQAKLTNTKMTLPAIDQMAEQLCGFADAIKARKTTTGASAAEGRKVQSIVDAIYQSSDSGQPVAF